MTDSNDRISESSSSPGSSYWTFSSSDEEVENDDKAQSFVGCKHYARRCLFLSPCCGKIYPCRVCHDDDSSHTINRHSVNEIICALCETRQGISNRCISCDVEFGKYSCLICRMFDDAEKGQFHCDGCGICRVGGRENYFHCDICGYCLPLSCKDNHKCIEQNSHQNCPVCMEDIHTSRDTTKVAKCGHLMHSKCYKAFRRKGDYRCPICGVSLDDMKEFWKVIDQEISETPMPDEYANQNKWILCKDCHKVNSVLFHVLGLKCSDCGSYNTCSTTPPMQQETSV